MERGGTGGAKGELREGERVGRMRMGEGRMERGGSEGANGERGKGYGE